MIKKILLIFYFIVFIILNIIDFTGNLTRHGDIDFLKKILSWSIIIYLFYKLSFTKLFIGSREKLYDILYLISFSLLVIPKLLFHYVIISISNEELVFNYFNFIIYFLRSFEQEAIISIIQTSFNSGIILTIIISIILIQNKEIKNKSLLGSLDIKNKLLIHTYMILVTLFFGLIIFNFFMEWFALSVDSIILILGLIYYLSKIIKDHSKNKISNFLHNVSNSGNSFYNNTIEKFSSKKTFFIGISVILTLHLLVDIGVYIFPYIFGGGNILYLSQLDYSLLNIYDPLNSSIIIDILTQNAYLSIPIILIYISNIFIVSTFLILPFYYIMKNIENKKIDFKNKFHILFIFSSILYSLVFLFPNIENPLSISISENPNIYGAKIDSNTIFENNENENEKVIFLYLILICSIILTFLLSNKIIKEKIKKKIIPTLTLMFFIFYICIFYISIISRLIISQNLTLLDFITMIFVSIFYILGLIEFIKLFIEKNFSKTI